MHREPVESSNIVSHGHDGSTLELEFKGGRVYQYACDAATYKAFCEAPSKGQFFAARIKNLPFKRVGT